MGGYVHDTYKRRTRYVPHRYTIGTPYVHVIDIRRAGFHQTIMRHLHQMIFGAHRSAALGIRVAVQRPNGMGCHLLGEYTNRLTNLTTSLTEPLTTAHHKAANRVRTLPDLASVFFLTSRTSENLYRIVSAKVRRHQRSEGEFGQCSDRVRRISCRQPSGCDCVPED